MLKNEELPIGFTMHLAQNQKAMTEFAKMSEDEQRNVVENARDMESYEAMKSYVDNGFVKWWENRAWEKSWGGSLDIWIMKIEIKTFTFYRFSNNIRVCDREWFGKKTRRKYMGEKRILYHGNQIEMFERS